jgi:hypothetical protein
MRRITPAIVLFLFGFMLVFCTDTRAAEVVVHVASYHNDRDRNWNENNLGIGLKIAQSEQVSYQVGTYRNSYFKQSYYAVAQYEVGSDLRAGAFAGVVSGYKTPVAAGFLLSYGMTTLRVVPPVGSQVTGVTTIELRKAF